MDAIRLLPSAPGLRRAALFLAMCLVALASTNRADAARMGGDLVVDSVLVPAAADETEAIQISWTVRNAGDAPVSGPWSDKVLLSEDPNVGDDIFLQAFTFNGTLAAGESYTRSEVVFLPQGEAGSLWMVVTTDAGNFVTEEDEGNNTTVSRNSVEVTPLYPDLVVTDIEISATSFNTWDETVTVTWTVENQGTAPAVRNRYDRITFSRDDVPGGDSNTNYELSVSLSGNPQLPGESRTYSRDIRPYSTIGGEGYLGIKVDRAGQENEGPDGESNDFIDDTLVTIGTPDLVVTSVTSTLQYPSFPGDSVSVEWTVENQGVGTARTWWSSNDRVYLSADDVAGNADDVLVGNRELISLINDADGVVTNDGMQPGESYATSVTFSIPSSIPSGIYYIVLKLDTSNSYYELPDDDDPWFVRPPAGADLVVATISVPSEVEIGEIIPVTWTVRNDGFTAAEGPWFDEFLLSDDLSVGGDISLGSFAFNGTLAAGETYQRTEFVTIPLEAAGVNFFLVLTDAGQGVEELDENNNLLASDDEFETVAADLVVSASSAPSTAVLGSPVEVTFTIANEGTSIVDGWVDAVFHSLDDTFGIDDTLIGSGSNPVSLGPGESYEASVVVTLPTDGSIPSGPGHLFVLADFGNLLLELNDGNNLGVALPIDVVQPDLPDLVVDSIAFTTPASASQQVSIDWSVENQGTAAAEGAWRERVAIAPVSDPASRTILGTWTYDGPLPIGASADRTRSVTLPAADGAFIVSIEVDVDRQVDEADGEGNNLTDAVQTLDIDAANLVGASITAPGIVEKGVANVIDFTGRNDGVGESHGGGWTDRLYLSNDEILDKGDLLLGSRERDLDGLMPGGTWADSVAIEIPLGIKIGPHRLILQVDATGTRYESDESDNVLVSDPIEIVEPIRPNLVISEISVPKVGSTLDTVEISWTVTNTGPTDAAGPWSDRLFKSSDDTVGGDVAVATVETPGPLAAGRSIVVSATVELPAAPTSLWFLVQTDVFDDVEEVAGETDNMSGIAGPIVIDYPDAPDLVVTAASGPASAESGAVISVSWTTCNLGGLATDGLWRDRIYLSDDRTVGDDLLVGEFVRTDAIDPDACPSYTGLVQVPLEVIGPRHLIVTTDALDELYEGGGESNNTFVSSTPIDFTEPALPNLVIDSISIPATAEAGSEIAISWIGRNDGAASSGTTWTDKVYLSTDQVLQPGDVLLASRLHIGALDPGESWSPSVSVTLPENPGPRYVLIAADVDDVIEEGTGELDNLAVSASTIEITDPPRPDLVATLTSGPDEVTAGDTVQLSWTVSNAGAASTAGGWSDAVYLSDDTRLGSDDELLRLQPYNAGPLDPGVGYDRTVAVVIPVSYLPADKYLLVATDFNTDLVESDEGNNLAVSAAVPIAETPAADLAVAEVTISGSTATFGDTIDITFRSTNTGDLPADGVWTDYVLISADDTINTGDLPVAVVTYSGDPVPVGGEYVRKATAELPLTNNYPDGDYRFIVVTDAANAIVESNETNNELASQPISITRPPLPDLAVTTGGMPSDVAAGVPFDVVITFTNAGAEPVEGNWFTSISLTDSAGGGTALLQDFITASTIAPGDTLDVIRSVTLPDNGAADAVLVFEVDSRDGLVEADEGNNSHVTAAVEYRRPDLVAVSVSMPNAATAGETVSITVTGRNDGTSPTFGYWTDVVALSADTAVGGDRVIGAATFTEVVSAGDTYSRTFEVTLPEDLAGTFHAVLQTDPADSLRELEDENASLIDLSTTIEIVQPDRPNLVVSDISIPGSVVAGASFDVVFTVTNEGPAEASGSWIDQIWLSDNDLLTPGDISGAQALRPTTLPVGSRYTQTVSVSAPTTPGSWTIFVQTDAGDTVIERSGTGESDNVASADTQLIVRGVVVVASITEDEVQIGSPLTITGSATVAGTGEIAANAPTRIRTTLQGYPTVLPVSTDVNGEFSIEWMPPPGVGGTVSIAAAAATGDFGGPLDQAVVWGLAVTPVPATITIPQSGAIASVIEIENLTDLPITGVSVSASSGTEGLDAEVFVPGASILAPNEIREVTLTVSAPGVSVGQHPIDIAVETVEVDSIAEVVMCGVVESIPTLVATPSMLQRDMVVGEISYAEVSIRNVGYAATGPLDVLISDVEWLELVSPAVLEPLEPGESAVVSLRLSPDADILQGPYTSTPGIVVRDRADASVGVGVNTIFNATSTSLAAIEINATNEFTYYGDPPSYPDATVEVVRQSDGALVASGQVDTDGFIRFDRLEPGFYRVAASADGHGSFATTVNAQGGQTTSLEAFMSRSVVSYSWDVVPIDFGDEYIIDLSLDYETNVPAPVIVIDPVVIDFTTMTQPSEYRELTITNHGLVTADAFRWEVANTSRFEAVPLVESVGDVPPGVTITAPFLLIDHGFADGVAGGLCDAPGVSATWELTCGETRLYSIQLGIRAGELLCGGTGNVPCVGCGNTNGDGSPPGGGGGGSYDGSGPGQTNQPPGSGTITIDVCCAADCIYRVLQAGNACGVPLPPPLKIALEGADLAECLIEAGATIGALRCILPLPPPIECGCAVAKAAYSCKCAPRDPCGDAFGGGGGGPNGFGPDDFGDPRVVWAVPDPGSVDWSDRWVHEAVGRIYRILRPSLYRIGIADWYDLEPDEAQLEIGRVVKEAVFATTWEESDGGVRITAAEIAGVLQLPLGDVLEEEEIQYFAERWNRTIDYWAMGWFTAAEVPDGLTLDFVDLEVLEEFRLDAVAAHAELLDAGYEFLHDEFIEAFAAFEAEQGGDGQGSCVEIQIEIEQRALITREAFEARLTLSNDSELPIEGIRVDVVIETLDGEDATSRFAVLGPEVTGMGDVDGSGFLDIGASGEAIWTLVPGDSAAAQGPTAYEVSGRIVYAYQGQVLEIPLFPVRIDVYPNASLNLQYFIESPVIGDDPFTPEIEPSVPFSLGLWILNEGGGTAGDVRIESGQPIIVAAETGGEATDVLIDFQLIGSQVNGEEVSPGLDVSFGDIEPGEVGVARWLMLCSLQGEFTGYSATVRSVNGFDDPEFSIIDAIDVNRLEHVVRGDEPFDDGVPDFLVDVVSDGSDLPDTVYLSSTAVEPVTAIADPATSVTGVRSATIDAGAGGGWRFIRIDDPFNAAYRLASVVRGDGKTIQLGSNAWQVDYIDRRTPEPTPRRYVKIFDRGGDGVYHLEFEPDVDGPTVRAWRSILDHGSLGPIGLDLPTGVPASEPRGAVSSLVVSFDEPVDAATANAAAVSIVGLDPDGVPIDPGAFNRTLVLGAGELSATLGFDPPLPAGRYCIRLVGMADQAGNLLDGETSRLDLAVAPGDASGDLKVNASDGGGVASLVGTSEIDRDDLFEVRSDLDRDGDIDLNDVAIVTANRPSDLTWLVTTCTVLNGEAGGKSGPAPVAWHGDGTIDSGGVLVDRIEDSVTSGPRGGAGGGEEGRESFEELAGPTVDLSWGGIDGEEVSFPVLLERIAVRSTQPGTDAGAILASFGVSRSMIETLSADGWVWGRLPGHLATPEGHASLAARLAAEGVESSPVVVIDADRIMVARPAVLVAFDDAIPETWRSQVVGVVSPDASRTSTSQEGVERVTLASHFGGDAIADAGVYAFRTEIWMAEPVWRLLPVAANTLPEPPLSTAARRWRSLRADLDLDGRVTGLDLELMSEVILGERYEERFDLTGDGVVDMNDFVAVAEEVMP